MSAFQRWRLATVTAAVEKLRQQERTGSIGRGAVVAQAALKRRDAGRLSAGFRRWREADAEVRVKRRGPTRRMEERVPDDRTYFYIYICLLCGCSAKIWKVCCPVEGRYRP